VVETVDEVESSVWEKRGACIQEACKGEGSGSEVDE
jgi:hypothetical protein